MKRLALLATVLCAGCLGAFQNILIVPQPKPPAVYNVACVVTEPSGKPVSGAVCTIEGQHGTTNADGYFLAANIPAGDRLFAVTKDGYTSASTAFTNDHNQNVAIVLAPIVPPLPAPASRDAITHSTVSMNSLWIDVPGYGRLPWFEGTLSSFTPEQRQAIYAAKHANGDTAAIVNVSWNYAEPGQPYGSGNQVPPRDLTGDLPTYRALVEEVIRHGFVPWVFLAGDGESKPDCSYNDPVGWTYGYDCTVTKTLPAVLSELQQPPDLTAYALFVPGYDGVFYGWEPSNVKVPGFAAALHQRCPSCLAGIEFNTGHIPIGNGPADYEPGGAMSGYAVLLGEFDVWPRTGDPAWQVIGRLARPYHRPADQPAGDDPNPPYYLQNSSIVFHCFEWGTYAHVRGQDVSAGYAYFVNLGCPVTEK